MWISCTAKLVCKSSIWKAGLALRCSAALSISVTVFTKDFLLWHVNEAERLTRSLDLFIHYDLWLLWPSSQQFQQSSILNVWKLLYFQQLEKLMNPNTTQSPDLSVCLLPICTTHCVLRDTKLHNSEEVRACCNRFLKAMTTIWQCTPPLLSPCFSSLTQSILVRRPCLTISLLQLLFVHPCSLLQVTEMEQERLQGAAIPSFATTVESPEYSCETPLTEINTYIPSCDLHKNHAAMKYLILEGTLEALQVCILHETYIPSSPSTYQYFYHVTPWNKCWIKRVFSCWIHNGPA